MTEAAFRELVSRMRAAQVAWFKHKRREDLHLAQRLERQVDVELTQPGMFDRQQEGGAPWKP